MPLEGLRAWIGEVERKLGKRTRVFLVLTVIAIGAAGAAIYLAVDARESSVSESDVQALQQELEAQIDEAAATGVVPTTPEEPVEPAPEPEPEAPPNPQNGAQGGTNGGASPEGTGSSGGASTPSGPGSAELGRLLEQTEKKNAKLEEEQAAKRAAK